MSSIDLLGIGQRRRTPRGVHAECQRDQDADPLALREPPPAPGHEGDDETAATAATIWPADIAAEGTRASRPSGRGGLAERATTDPGTRRRPRRRPEPRRARSGRARAGDRRAERAGGVSRSSISRQLGPQRQRRGLEVVVERGGEPGGVATARRPAPRSGSGSRRLGQPPAGRARRTRRRWTVPRASGTSTSAERRQLDRLHRLARALHERVAGLDLAGHVGAQARRPARAGRSRRAGPLPCGWPSRSTAAASALPPPSPAATGIRLSMRTAAGAGPGRRAPERLEAAAARLRPSTPGQSTSSSPPAAARPTSSARSSEANSEHERVQPVRPRRADVQHEVDLRGGALGRARRPRGRADRGGRCVGSARRSRAGASRSARRPGRRGRAPRAPRGRAVADAVRRPGRQRQRSGQCLAPVGERGVHERDELRRRRRPVRRSSHQRGLHVRLRVEHRARHARAGPARRRPAGPAPTWRRSSCPPGAAARRSPTSRWTIATHSSALRELLHRLQQHRGRHAVGQVGHHLAWARGPARRGRSSRRRPGAASALAKGSSASRSAGSSERSTSTTCRWPTRGARYSDSTPSPPPTSSTTSAGSSSAARPITPRMLSSMRKFWPSSRLGRTSNGRSRLRLAWRGSGVGRGHQPKTRAAFASTVRSSAS